MDSSIRCTRNEIMGWILLFIMGALLVFPTEIMGEQLDTKISNPEMEHDFAPLFKTSFDQLEIINEVYGHGGINFEIASRSQPLKLNEFFVEIELNSGALGKEREAWMTHCYFRPHSEEQSRGKTGELIVGKSKGDIWAYIDNKFSKAFIVGESYCGKSRNYFVREPEFANVFKTSVQKIKFGNYYRTNNISCFEVLSPLEPLVLRYSFQNINPTFYTNEFPPGQKLEPWMSKGFYYSQPASNSEAKEDFWIFTNDRLDHAYVIAKFPEGKGRDIYYYPKVVSGWRVPYKR